MLGVVSIFNYGFDTVKNAFEKAGVPYVSLSDYPTLISLALEKGIVSAQDQDVLLKWSADPANWPAPPQAARP